MDDTPQLGTCDWNLGAHSIPHPQMVGCFGAWRPTPSGTGEPSKAVLLTGDCSIDCIDECAEPGRFPECVSGDEGSGTRVVTDG